MDGTQTYTAIPVKETSNTIITKHTAESMAAATVPLPLLDIAALSAIHVAMVKNLCELYDVDFNREKTKALTSSLLFAAGGAIAGNTGANTVQMVPVIGMVLGAGSKVLTAGATTYMLGTIIEEHLRNEGSLEDLNLSWAKEQAKNTIESGTKAAGNILAGLKRGITD
jgi:uncharacterized protein (DUF697 family)